MLDYQKDAYPAYDVEPEDGIPVPCALGQPWVNEDDARKKGQSVEQFAAQLQYQRSVHVDLTLFRTLTAGLTLFRRLTAGPSSRQSQTPR